MRNVLRTNFIQTYRPLCSNLTSWCRYALYSSILKLFSQNTSVRVTTGRIIAMAKKKF